MADEDLIDVQLDITCTGLITTKMTKAAADRLEAKFQEDGGPVDLVDDDYGINMDDVMNGLNMEVGDFNIIKPKKKT